MDSDALNEWAGIDEEYDIEIDRLLRSSGIAPAGSPTERRLAGLRQRRADAEDRLRRSLGEYVGTPAVPTPDTGSIVILGRD